MEVALALLLVLLLPSQYSYYSLYMGCQHSVGEEAVNQEVQTLTYKFQLQQGVVLQADKKRTMCFVKIPPLRWRDFCWIGIEFDILTMNSMPNPYPNFIGKTE